MSAEPGVGHDRPHVGEVQVDQAGDRDEVRDALDALAQDVVGLAERLEDRGAALHDRQELLVRDDDERVHDLAQALDALVGLAHPLRALELERLGDHADGERADLVLGDLRDDGAAPVPVPPPSPAVTNTMSAPLSASLMSSRDSARRRSRPRGWRPRRGPSSSRGRCSA
jgi:hypothetical protein